MNRVLVTVAYLAVVWIGALSVNHFVTEHRRNVALEQLQKECLPFYAFENGVDSAGRRYFRPGEQWVFVCAGQLTMVGDRMNEMVQDDGSL